MGNIKGTYGYLDENGEIKRVSYSSANGSEIVENKEGVTVVQRIPKIVKPTTSMRTPIIIYPNLTTPPPLTSTTVIQTIPKRRNTTLKNFSKSESTEKPVREEKSESSTVSNRLEKVVSTKSNIVFSTVAPARILAQSKPLVRSNVQKSEGQISRPDVPESTTRVSPYIKRLPIKATLLDNESSNTKPVTEGPEVKSNLLRRQLNHGTPFDPKQHVFNLRQGHGTDSVDIYSGSFTTGSPGPLFTTTSRSRSFSPNAALVNGRTINVGIIDRGSVHRNPVAENSGDSGGDVVAGGSISSSTIPTRTIPGSFSPSSFPSSAYPTSSFPTGSLSSTTISPGSVNAGLSNPIQVTPISASTTPSTRTTPATILQNRIPIRDPPPIITKYIAEEATTDESTPYPTYTTPNPIPVVQIPSSRVNHERVVALPHPFHRGAVLVPVSHYHSEEQNSARPPPHYVVAKEFRTSQPTSQPPQNVAVAPVFFRRIPEMVPMPVQVDENGYITEIPQGKSVPVLQPIPMPPQEEIDRIKPPVSTRDFQKLLEQLIIRQSRLEQISMLTRRPDLYMPRYRTYYQPTQVPVPFFLNRQEERNGPIQFLPQENDKRFVEVNGPNSEAQSSHHHVYIRPRPHTEYHRDQMVYTTTPNSLMPTRRVVRLLNPKAYEENQREDNYLPPDVREMLLLKMLQLAINPALPLDGTEMEAVMKSVNRVKKTPVRNVEILGEETELKKNMK